MLEEIDRSRTYAQADTCEIIGNVLLYPLRLCCGSTVVVNNDLSFFEQKYPSLGARITAIFFSVVLFPITFFSTLAGWAFTSCSGTYGDAHSKSIEQVEKLFKTVNNSNPTADDIKQAKNLVSADILNSKINVPGNTTLHQLIKSGNLELAIDLIGKGAAITNTNNEGHTPFQVLLDILFEKSQDPEEDIADIINNYADIIRTFIDQGQDPNVATDTEDTILHIVCYANNAELAKYLIGKNADINHLDEEYVSPLEMFNPAALIETLGELTEEQKTNALVRVFNTIQYRGKNISEKSKFIQALINSGADKNATLSRKTAMHLACESGELGLVEYLIGQGANLNSLNEFGRSPLNLAIKHGHFVCANALLAAGAPIQYKYDEKDVIIFQQLLEKISENISKGQELIQTFIELGADCNQTIKFNITPLHIASAIGNSELVKYLISKGANLNAQTDSLNTPLHHAISNNNVLNNNIDVIKELIQAGADYNLQNVSGISPFDRIKAKGIEIEFPPIVGDISGYIKEIKKTDRNDFIYRPDAAYKVFSIINKQTELTEEQVQEISEDGFIDKLDYLAETSLMKIILDGNKKVLICNISNAAADEYVIAPSGKVYGKPAIEDYLDNNKVGPEGNRIKKEDLVPIPKDYIPSIEDEKVEEMLSEVELKALLGRFNIPEDYLDSIDNSYKAIKALSDDKSNDPNIKGNFGPALKKEERDALVTIAAQCIHKHNVNDLPELACSVDYCTTEDLLIGSDGSIYAPANIIGYLETNGTSPATRNPMTLKDMIKLPENIQNKVNSLIKLASLTTSTSAESK